MEEDGELIEICSIEPETGVSVYTTIAGVQVRSVYFSVVDSLCFTPDSAREMARLLIEAAARWEVEAEREKQYGN